MKIEGIENVFCREDFFSQFEYWKKISCVAMKGYVFDRYL